MPFDIDPKYIEAPTLEPWRQVLLDAAAIVRVRWRQGGWGLDGEPRCAVGAISEVMGFEIEKEEQAVPMSDAESYLKKWLKKEVAVWNDEPCRTAEEVALAMEACARQKE